MKCNIHRLSLYLDGELSLPQRHDLQRHLSRCCDCRHQLQSLRELDRIIAEWSEGRRPLPPETDARIRSSVDGGRHLRPLLALSRIMPAALGSSVAALLILMSASHGWLSREPASLSASPATPHIQKLIKSQSAPLYKARGTSAMFGVRSPTVNDQTPRRRQFLEVE